MFGKPTPRFALLSVLAVLLAGLATLGAVGVGPDQATASAPTTAGGSKGCTQRDEFESDDFPRRPKISSRFLPMVPGTQTILEGTVEGVPHRVVFTVTDLVKKIDGVRSLIIWDTDESDGELVESELSFFAQDKEGNVWNLGEYPEEFEDGVFAGAPSTWITGENDAEAGIHMPARRPVSSRQYIQGFAPEIDFLDCAQVVQRDVELCVPAGCSDEVLITHETNLLDPEGGIQSKFHAPKVGIIAVGSVEPATGEILELVERVHLDRAEMREVREEVLRLDLRGYRFGEGYDATSPAKRLD